MSEILGTSIEIRCNSHVHSGLPVGELGDFDFNRSSLLWIKLKSI